MGFVREQVAKLEERGVVKAVRTPPRCINPLSVAAKELGDKKKASVMPGSEQTCERSS